MRMCVCVCVFDEHAWPMCVCVCVFDEHAWPMLPLLLVGGVLHILIAISKGRHFIHFCPI